MSAQVVVTKAKLKDCNGTYNKGETYNHRSTYQHESGARIYYDTRVRAWVLSRSGSFHDADYTEKSEDVAPPDGEWSHKLGNGSCRVQDLFLIQQTSSGGFSVRLSHVSARDRRASSHSARLRLQPLRPRPQTNRRYRRYSSMVRRTSPTSTLASTKQRRQPNA